MRKVDDATEKKEKKEKKRKKKSKKRKEKRMAFIVATNVVASRPPKRRPTGTPHARAKDCCHIKKLSRILLPSDVVKLHCKM